MEEVGGAETAAEHAPAPDELVLLAEVLVADGALVQEAIVFGELALFALFQVGVLGPARIVPPGVA
jgi:hypothetical protein